jgi:hypothetical protein
VIRKRRLGRGPPPGPFRSPLSGTHSANLPRDPWSGIRRPFPIFDAPGFDEGFEGGERVLLGLGHPDLVERPLGFRVLALRQLVQDIGGLVDPAALAAGIWPYLRACSFWPSLDERGRHVVAVPHPPFDCYWESCGCRDHQRCGPSTTLRLGRPPSGAFEKARRDGQRLPPGVFEAGTMAAWGVDELIDRDRFESGMPGLVRARLHRSSLWLPIRQADGSGREGTR